MRLAEIAREAWRNVVSGASRSLLTVAVMLLVCGLAGGLEVVTISAIDDKVTEFRDSGAAVLVLDAQAGVDPVACDRLAEVDGVVAAGALRTSETQIHLSAAPDNPVRVVEATPGLSMLLDIAGMQGLRLESDLADTLGVAGGESLSTSAGQLPVLGTFEYPDDGRDPVLLGSALVVSDATMARALPGSYDQCWIEVWPFNANASTLLRSSLTNAANAETQVQVGQLNTRFGTENSAPADFAQRPSRWAWGAAWAAGLALALGVTRLRRLELAFARHLGVDRARQGLQLVLEVLILSPAVVIPSVALIMWLSVRAGEIQWWLASHGFVIVGAAVLGLAIGAAVGAALIREQDLFSYFKRRP